MNAESKYVKIIWEKCLQTAFDSAHLLCYIMSCEAASEYEIHTWTQH